MLVYEFEGGDEGDNQRPPVIVADHECKNWGDRLPAAAHAPVVAGIVQRAVSVFDTSMSISLSSVAARGSVRSANVGLEAARRE